MQTALILGGALGLGLLGGWGTWRLLGQLDLDQSERLALTLALFPAALGVAAFGGLLVGWPGPLLPAILCAVLGVLPLTPMAYHGAPPLRGVPTAPSPSRTRGPLASTNTGPPLRGANIGSADIPSGLPASPFPASRGEGRPTQSHGDSVAGSGPDDRWFPLARDPRMQGPSAARHPLHRERGPGGEGSVAAAVLLYAAGALGTTLLTPLAGGALRIGDWLAHWFLVVIYLGQPMPDLRVFTNRVGDFGVISRPPLYNLEGGLLVGALDGQFWPFPLLTPLLALPVAAAGVLWARRIGGEGAARVLAPLIGLSPFLIQNASYPWSKMVAGGLVLLFLYLLREAALARRPGRARQTFVLAALCAGLGYLAHQTTIFYVLPSLLWLVLRRPRPLFRRPAGWTVTTWALSGLVGLAAFMPWQGWVLLTYGLRAVLDASPASFDADVTDTFGGWLAKGVVAALGTLVPLPALGALARGSAPSLDQLLRIQLALLTGALGVSGCWLLVRGVRSQESGVRRGVPSPPWPTMGPLRCAVSPRPPLPQGERGDPRKLQDFPWMTERSPSPDAGETAQPRGPAFVQAGRGGQGVRAFPGVRALLRPPWLPLVVLCGFLGQVMLQPNWHDTGDAAESMTPIVVLGLAYVAQEATRLGVRARRIFFGLVLLETGLYLALWLWWALSPAWTRDPNAVLASRYGLVYLRGLWAGAAPLGGLLLVAGLGGSALLLWRELFGAGSGAQSSSEPDITSAAASAPPSASTS